MIEPTKREELITILEKYVDTPRQLWNEIPAQVRVKNVSALVCEIIAFALNAASAQSAEPQEAGKPSIDDIDRVEGAVDCYAKLYKEPAAQWSWRRIKSALRARLASKPSRPPCQVCGSTSDREGCECCMPIADDAPSGRPSREEEMREALIKAGRDEWFRDTTTISWSRIERALRAALAQGGARDEAQGEGER